MIPGFKASENVVLNRESTLNSFLEGVFGSRIKAIDKKEIDERAKGALSNLGVDIKSSTVISEMPVAHKQFTEIAREIERENTKLLVLDEPTAVLTEEEAKVLLETMKKLSEKGIAILFITHRLDEISSSFRNNRHTKYTFHQCRFSCSVFSDNTDKLSLFY